MGAAVHGVDVVGEGEDVLGVPVVVLQGDFDDGRAILSLDVHRPVVEDFLVLVEVAHEADQATLEVEGLLARRRLTLVAEGDPDPLVQVGRLAEPLRDRLEAPVQGLEDLAVGHEDGRRPMAIRAAQLAHRTGGLAALVALAPDAAVAFRLHIHPGRQGVDHAHADAVQAAGDLVAAAAELAAGVEDRVHHLEGVLARLMPAHRHATAVVPVAHRPVGQQGDLDAVGEAGHGFVDGVVDDLPDQVVEAPHIRGADVHAGAPADGLQALEDLDALGGVAGAGAGALAASRRAVGRRGLGLSDAVERLGGLGHAGLPPRRSTRRPRSSGP